MAQYKKRSDGRYAAQIRTGKYNSQGKPEIITLYAKTSKELEKLVAEKKYELGHGLYCFHNETPFGQYAEEWLKVMKANSSLKTREMYRSTLANYIGLLRDRPIGRITPTDIQRQVNDIADRPRTCQILVLTLNQIFKRAITDQLITRNPVVDIQLPKATKKEKRALTKAEKAAVKSAEMTVEERAYIMLLYGCGLRPAEADALTWSSVDLKSGEIHITQALEFDGEIARTKPPKTDSGIRTVPMPTVTLKALKALKADSSTLIVFAGNTGGYKSRGGYSDLFKRCKNAIELKLGHRTDLCAYMFRHNYATELYYSGVSLKEAQRLMGHSDLRMIMDVYAHLDAEKENTKEKINSIAF